MVTISLCMIVRDEEAVLARCLDSVREAVDEMVIVDTGSLDRTKEIASLYTEKVYDFPWIDDFAAARNASFSRAGMDYCMWLDADDVMTKGERDRLIAWKEQADGSADAVMMKYAAGMDEEGRETFCYYRERLVRRDRGFRWKGRVHEAMEVHGNVEYLDIRVEHRSRKKIYGDRNLKIYERMRTEGEVLSARDLFYYGRELYYHGRYEEAVGCFLFFLDRKDGFLENQVEACRFASYCLYALGKEEKALQYLYRGLTYRAPGGELCCDLGEHFFNRRRWKEAAFWYGRALEAERKEGAGAFMIEDCYEYLPCIQLCVCCYHLGNQIKAEEYNERAGKIKPDSEAFLYNRSFFAGLHTGNE